MFVLLTIQIIVQSGKIIDMKINHLPFLKCRIEPKTEFSMVAGEPQSIYSVPRPPLSKNISQLWLLEHSVLARLKCGYVPRFCGLQNL